MQNQGVSKFQVQLDPEYEKVIFNRFIELADEAIQQSIERASIHKQFLTDYCQRNVPAMPSFVPPFAKKCTSQCQPVYHLLTSV